MSYEQARMATAFTNFIQNLDSKKVDYRIAVTTTDIASATNAARAVNGNGALQDGNLIGFSGGVSFLTRSSGSVAQIDTAFKNVIRRPETLACEQFIVDWIGAGQSMETTAYTDAYYAACPSGDERGIYAANLVIQNNPASFIRPEASLAVIFLADEDVRSQLYYYNQPGFALVDQDKATSFVSLMQSKYPNKAYRAHSIITKDANCLATQNSQTGGVVSGSYGLEYAALTNQTSGILGDICAASYATQLQNIFNNIQGQILDKVALYCSTPSDLTVTLIPDPGIGHSVVDREVRFNTKLPVGTTVQVSYSCETL
jgi:hypothetical protein